MPLDLYSPCPCGSGKKFKWCCHPIAAEIERALIQDAEGQHEAALRLMDEVAGRHPDNPEVWGRKAQLLYQNDRVDDAEEALQKAFDINPNYPFGLLLRGMFRFYEGEVPGALLLFRKAVEAYDPVARDALAQLYEYIADCELKLNRPVAAHAAFRIALRCRPDREEVRQALDRLFGAQSPLPVSARHNYTFRSPDPGVAGPRRASWSQALSNSAESPRLSEPARVFARLTEEDPHDTAAWYNLAVARAWLGDNRAALEALDHYVELEADETKAGEAWALGEVLRMGQGMEEEADHLEHSVVYQIRDPRPVGALLQEWDKSSRFLVMEAAQEEGMVRALVMEPASRLTVTTTGPAAQPQRVAAHLLVLGQLLRLWHPQKETLGRIIQEVAQKAGKGLTEGAERVTHGNFGDVVLEAVVYVPGVKEKEQVEKYARDHAGRFFEETWIHRPLKSLGRIAPVDAAGHRVLRKKLRGVVQFLQECAVGGMVETYDFDRLRRKLGLLDGSAAAAPKAEGAAPDIGSLGAAELAGLPVTTLPPEQLEVAYQTAVKLDAQELATRFARELVTRSPRPDRSPWYFYLIKRALAEGNLDEALSTVDEGERADCEHNEGRRRNDFELRRGQVHTRRGEADQAHQVFSSLLERVPSDLDYQGTATEAMLSLRQGARALRFAEEGLAKARQQNNRDAEERFLDLVNAAKKQGG
jgi:tetratricopeptide (TPR) repeat protein